MTSREDRLATEEPLEIRLSWPGRPAHRVAVSMRTPGHDFELAAGFLAGEGVLGSADDLNTVAYCTDDALTPQQEYNVVTVDLRLPPRQEPAARYGGLAGATSACGVCGTESIEDVLSRFRAQPGEWDGSVSPDVVLALPEALRTGQRVFEATGGLHAAGLFTVDGALVVVREDVGRHNAVDKVVGAQLLGRAAVPPLLCVSGRVGFEIVQKAAAAGVRVLVAVGAPSSLAVDLARQVGLCVVGFTGRGRFVGYAGAGRLGV